MSNDFKEKLQLYKEGMLNEAEAALIEKEIERYEAIREYLDDDEIIHRCKEEMNSKVPEVSSVGKNINKKMVSKIISLSLATIFACLIIIPMLYISTVSLVGRATRIDSSRFAQERNFAEQFLKMSFPQVTTVGGSDHTEFHKQNFTCNYLEGIGRKAQIGKIEVNYSFGKLKKPKHTTNERLQFFYSDRFYAVNPKTYFNSTEWDYLSKAPEGTNAQIFITFKSKFNPQQVVTALGEQYFDSQKNFNITMLTDINSEIVISNINPAYFYEGNRTSISKQDELNYMNKFNAYENDVQKQVLLYGLKQIKNHKNIADYITGNYSGELELVFEDIDGSISYVEKNGVQYIGALITGDTKELLKLKDNPNIFACSVEDLVVW